MRGRAYECRGSTGRAAISPVPVRTRLGVAVSLTDCTGEVPEPGRMDRTANAGSAFKWTVGSNPTLSAPRIAGSRRSGRRPPAPRERRPEGNTFSSAVSRCRGLHCCPQQALVAQWIEHLTTDQKVRGSSPFERAERMCRSSCSDTEGPAVKRGPRSFSARCLTDYQLEVVMAWKPTGRAREVDAWDQEQLHQFLSTIADHRWSAPLYESRGVVGFALTRSSMWLRWRVRVRRAERHQCGTRGGWPWSARRGSGARWSTRRVGRRGRRR